MLNLNNPIGIITPNFRYEELWCKCHTCSIPHKVQNELDRIIKEVLQKLRTQLGRAIHVNSAYRCTAHNRNVNGAINSMHMKGAIDFSVRGMKPSCVYTVLDGFLRDNYESSGLGNYPSFTHLDLRPGEHHARW